VRLGRSGAGEGLAALLAHEVAHQWCAKQEALRMVVVSELDMELTTVHGAGAPPSCYSPLPLSLPSLLSPPCTGDGESCSLAAAPRPLGLLPLKHSDVTVHRNTEGTEAEAPQVSPGRG